MRKTRNKVFETNSSSCHSLSIKSETNSPTIVENGILYIDRILTFTLDKGYITIATSKFEKLAFIIALLNDKKEMIKKLLNHYKLIGTSNPTNYTIWDEHDILRNKNFEELIKLINEEVTLIDEYEEY